MAKAAMPQGGASRQVARLQTALVPIEFQSCYERSALIARGEKAMLDRARMLGIIDEIYVLRVKGDTAGLNAFWAEGGQYRMAADPIHIEGFPVGPAGGPIAVAELVQMFRFHKVQRADAIVEGNAAVVHWHAAVSRGDGEPVTTEICDLWKFDDDGKIMSLLQFADTALIRAMLN
jgi:ketosteroid isomerase-like protein